MKYTLHPRYKPIRTTARTAAFIPWNIIKYMYIYKFLSILIIACLICLVEYLGHNTFEVKPRQTITADFYCQQLGLVNQADYKVFTPYQQKRCHITSRKNKILDIINRWIERIEIKNLRWKVLPFTHLIRLTLHPQITIYSSHCVERKLEMWKISKNEFPFFLTKIIFVLQVQNWKFAQYMGKDHWK